MTPFLALVLFGFAAFIAGLGGASIWSNWRRAPLEPRRRDA